jgi:hypothetical protein
MTSVADYDRYLLELTSEAERGLVVMGKVYQSMVMRNIEAVQEKAALEVTALEAGLAGNDELARRKRALLLGLLARSCFSSTRHFYINTKERH